MQELYRLRHEDTAGLPSPRQERSGLDVLRGGHCVLSDGFAQRSP